MIIYKKIFYIVNTSKRDNWFIDYHDNKEVSRFNKFKKEDFCGKKVLDIGCNAGQLSRYLIDKMEASEVLGVEYDKTAVKKAIELSKDYKIFDRRFRQLYVLY